MIKRTYPPMGTTGLTFSLITPRNTTHKTGFSASISLTYSGFKIFYLLWIISGFHQKHLHPSPQAAY